MTAPPVPGSAAFSDWLLTTCQGLLAAGRAPVIGLNGPVGAGKSTLARQLRQHCAAAGVRLAVASIDDAYWPWPERVRRLAGNPFGVSRVPPGSHDPEALAAAIRAWRGAADRVLELPRFDKTLRQGEGDRQAPWRGPADALLLEGWLLGCRPVGADVLQRHGALHGWDEPRRAWLQRCNGALAEYQGLWSQLDRLVVLWPTRWSSPRRWRFQAEARQRRSGGGWLAPAALQALVNASLESLPPDLFIRPLLAEASWVKVLDGRRRCLWEGSGDTMPERLAQPSSSCSSATG